MLTRIYLVLTYINISYNLTYTYMHVHIYLLNKSEQKNICFTLTSKVKITYEHFPTLPLCRDHGLLRDQNRALSLVSEVTVKSKFDTSLSAVRSIRDVESMPSMASNSRYFTTRSQAFSYVSRGNWVTGTRLQDWPAAPRMFQQYNFCDHSLIESP